MKYLITMGFDGTAYHGWQVQQNAVTVQQTVQDALEKLLGYRTGLTGCSRTDSGVHAEMFCAHFCADTGIPPNKIPAALNFYLPRDIAVYACRTVPEDFHARYSTLRKRYVYRILNTPYRNPFYEGRTLFVKTPLNVPLMHEAAQHFIGTYDFAALCSAGSSVEDTVRTVYKAHVSASDGIIEYHVEADGFLYNMVRIMTGTLIEAGLGKIRPEDIKSIIDSANRSKAGPTAPPHGLYLNRVYYDDVKGSGERI